MLSDLQRRLLPIGHQQVPDILIVDLQHGEGHFKGDTGALLSIDIFEYCIGKHGYESFVDAVAKDRVTLPTPSLAVCKQRSIESLPSIRDETLSQVVEYFALVHILRIINSKISVTSKKMSYYQNFLNINKKQPFFESVMTPVAVVKGKCFGVISILVEKYINILFHEYFFLSPPGW